MNKEKRLFYALFGVLICSMIVTEGLLLSEGRWREAVPLHLCSISAIAAALLALGRRQFLLNFLWYLGMPGAALALLFPAPAVSFCQTWMNASYFTTHALILLIPICRMISGMRPETGKIWRMMLVLLGIAGAAAAANSAFKTNFLFLSLPPAGTPLESVFSFGAPVYRLMLFVIMLLCCLMMDWVAGKFCCKTPE